MNPEEPHIEFLPSKPYSWDKLKKAVLENLNATVDLIPTLPATEVNLATLQEIEAGTYLLRERPSINLLRELPEHKEGVGEIGIFCINGRWLISLNNDTETYLPDTLTAIQHEGLFQADMHTHPGDDPGSRQPSNEDIYKLNSTIDGKNYIISKAGLIEFQWTGNLPGNNSHPTDVHKAWRHWITEDLKLTEDEFNKRGGWELKEEFYEKFFNLRTIPWENTDEIEGILMGREELKIDKKD
jgi:hypothetical protein